MCGGKVKNVVSQGSKWWQRISGYSKVQVELDGVVSRLAKLDEISANVECFKWIVFDNLDESIRIHFLWSTTRVPSHTILEVFFQKCSGRAKPRPPWFC